MQTFTRLTSGVIPLPFENVDTDQIIPASYLKVTDKSGLAEGLFSSWRYFPDGKLRPEFPLNQPQYQGCQILLVGDNFGCGSSREHAPWALLGWGIRAVISTSFADIFRNNALKNGLLPVIIDADAHQALFKMAQQGLNPAGQTIQKPFTSPVQATIDLAAQMLFLPDGSTTMFPIDAFSKTCLLGGLDQLGYLLRHEEAIARYERATAS